MYVKYLRLLYVKHPQLLHVHVCKIFMATVCKIQYLWLINVCKISTDTIHVCIISSSLFVKHVLHAGAEKNQH